MVLLQRQRSGGVARKPILGQHDITSTVVSECVLAVVRTSHSEAVQHDGVCGRVKCKVKVQQTIQDER